MNTAPVYSGMVVTLYCIDHVTDRPYPRTVPDHPDRIKAAQERTERSGDKVLRVGAPRAALPGEVPLATAKTLQQERIEKAAARRASANAQKGGKRVERAEKRAVVTKPAKVAKAAKPKQPKKRVSVPRTGIVPTNANAVVCISTGRFFGSILDAERQNGFGRTSLQYLLRSRPLPVAYNGGVYDLATPAEMKASACLRTLNDCPAITPQPLPRGGGKGKAKAILVLTTGTVFSDVGAFLRFAHVKRCWTSNLQPGEIRQTPAGTVRLATANEVKEWKLKNGK